MITLDTLNSVFNAKTVAVVGASNNPDKTGYQVLKNIIDGGYQGRIYPINPKAEEILGCSLLSIYAGCSRRYRFGCGDRARQVCSGYHARCGGEAC